MRLEILIPWYIWVKIWNKIITKITVFFTQIKTWIVKKIIEIYRNIIIRITSKIKA